MEKKAAGGVQGERCKGGEGAGKGLWYDTLVNRGFELGGGGGERKHVHVGGAWGKKCLPGP